MTPRAYTLWLSSEIADVNMERNSLKEKGAMFIQKPFSPKTIRDTLKGLLESGGGDEGTN